MSKPDEDRNLVKIYQLPLAGWLYMKDITLVDCWEDDRSSVFLFDDPECKTKQMEIDFLNSEAHKHDQAVRTLKNLLRSKKQRH